MSDFKMSPAAQQVAEAADALYNKQAFLEELPLLVDAVEKTPDDEEGKLELLWRLARCYMDVSETKDKKLPENEAFVKGHLEKGLKVAEAALALAEKLGTPHHGPHKWYAILISGITSFDGTKAKIEKSFLVKQHAEKAVALKPDDATSNHVLGRWSFEISNIGWLERKLAAVVYATPPESSYEEAIKYFLRCQELNPEFVRNAVFLGDSYYQLSKYAEAKEWYTKATKIAPKSTVDINLQKEAVEKAAKC